MTIGEALAKLSSPGDLAAFLLGWAGGFVFDAFALLGGVPTVEPLQAGVLGGSVALGAKKSIEAAWRERRLRSRARRRLHDLRALLSHVVDDARRRDFEFRVDLVLRDPSVSHVRMSELTAELEAEIYQPRFALEGGKKAEGA